MGNILIINTGGTFNKYYDSLIGKLVVDKSSKALDEILHNWLCKFQIINIIGKDSLDFNDHDRTLLYSTIANTSKETKIIIIHGTDTIDISADFIAQQNLPHTIVFTGAMVPFGINPIEATANFASAVGFLQAPQNGGVFIAMNGIILPYNEIIKDRKKGKFITKIV
ncbi:MAG TPA: asparaginase [Epsilonproteobacteria bacterium]|nr:asparaginase [Campylobacterota bacterium]